MAKTLSFTDTSPQTVKIGDTTTSFTLICGNDNVATDLTNATSITVKLGNVSGYLKSVAIDPASLTDPTTGQIVLALTTDLMTGLTAGDYQLEVWVVDSTGTSIYPSDRSTGFNVTNNIQSANGATITTITFDDFVQAMNKAASTIAKGDKGDTGTVDNAGLATAPAFVALQTQVDNSAVGTNLLSGTSSVKVRNPTWRNIINVDVTNLVGETLTYSEVLDITDSTRGSASVYLVPQDASGNSIGNTVGSNSINFGNVGKAIATITIPAGASKLNIYEQTNNTDLNPCVGSRKLELGSHATDWSLNPTEILTQSDYAKIKAAIVALGGSLS